MPDAPPDPALVARIQRAVAIVLGADLLLAAAVKALLRRGAAR